MWRVLKVKVKRYKIFCNVKNIVYHAILLHGYETGWKNIIGQYYLSKFSLGMFTVLTLTLTYISVIIYYYGYSNYRFVFYGWSPTGQRNGEYKCTYTHIVQLL